MALEAPLSIPEGKRERLQPMRPLVVVGAMTDIASPLERINDLIAARNNGYLANIRFIADTLGSATVIAGTTGIQEGDSFSRRAYGAFYTGWNDLLKIPPFPLSKSFHTTSTDELSYPRNLLAPIDPHLTISLEADNPLLQAIRTADPKHNIIVDSELGIGGRYVGLETGPLTFVAVPKVPDRASKIAFLYELMPEQTLMPLPLPSEIGIVDDKRVVDHIDQFIAHPLPLKDGSGYIVAIDEHYAELLYEHGTMLPTSTLDGKSITYRPVSFRYTANYLLNTVGSPTGQIFVEPELQYFLEHESGDWKSVDQTKVRVMPSNIPASEQTQGGSGCKIVILAT